MCVAYQPGIKTADKYRKTCMCLKEFQKDTQQSDNVGMWWEWRKKSWANRELWRERDFSQSYISLHLFWNHVKCSSYLKLNENKDVRKCNKTVAIKQINIFHCRGYTLFCLLIRLA